MLCHTNDYFCEGVISYCNKFSLETFCLCIEDNFYKFCQEASESRHFNFFYVLCVLFFLCNVLFCVCKVNFHQMTDNSFLLKTNANEKDAPPNYTENL